MTRWREMQCICGLANKHEVELLSTEGNGDKRGDDTSRI